MLSRSGHYLDRIAAAYALAWRVGDDRVDGALLALLNDFEDTAVTCAAAAELLRIRSDAALSVFAIGWNRADDSTGDDLSDELRIATNPPSFLRVERWSALAMSSADAEVRSGAAALLAWLGHRS